MENVKRSPEMRNFLDTLALKAFGRSATDAHAQKICVKCGQPATNFRDGLSEREYEISVFCQSCQDEAQRHFVVLEEKA